MACLAEAFTDPKLPRQAQRRIFKDFRLSAECYYCEECNAYHVRAILPNKRHRRILELLAEGYRDADIARQVGMTPRTVGWVVGELSKQFYSLNRPNLVAIVIALGIVNPQTFVPSVQEPKQRASAS